MNNYDAIYRILKAYRFSKTVKTFQLAQAIENAVKQNIERLEMTPVLEIALSCLCHWSHAVTLNQWYAALANISEGFSMELQRDYKLLNLLGYTSTYGQGRVWVTATKAGKAYVETSVPASV